MSGSLRNAAIALRSTLTAPLRRWQMQRMCDLQAAPLMVLFYHRVSDQRLNPWSITTRDFTRHLDLISESYEWIDLPELQRRILNGQSPRPAVHLTFDDGYSENCDYAIPEILRRRIPCTYFVTLHQMLTGEPFAHDAQRGLDIRPNSMSEIRDMASAGIEIGAHTRHHADMGGIRDPSRLHHEIVSSAQELGALVERPVRYFAFPYGLPANMPQEAIAKVAEGGMRGFCSAFGGYNIPGRDAFHIRRIHGDPELVRLRNWLSFDRRKLMMEPKVPYSIPSGLPDGR